MRDHLADNVALHSQVEDLRGHALACTPLPFRPRLREVPSLQSCMYCFAAYVAVRSNDPLTWDLLAYCRLVFREALRHGGTGGRSTTDHSVAKPPSFAGTFFRQACRQLPLWERDQVRAPSVANQTTPPPQCALAPVQQQVSPFPPSGGRVSETPNPVTSPCRIFRPARCPETALTICASWNRGTCIFWGHVATGMLAGTASSTTKASNVWPHRRGLYTTGSGWPAHQLKLRPLLSQHHYRWAPPCLFLFCFSFLSQALFTFPLVCFGFIGFWFIYIVDSCLYTCDCVSLLHYSIITLLSHRGVILMRGVSGGTQGRPYPRIRVSWVPYLVPQDHHGSARRGSRLASTATWGTWWTWRNVTLCQMWPPVAKRTVPNLVASPATVHAVPPAETKILRHI